ncbi:ATP-binding cassette domain-containing protein [Dactylosporangium sp. AC04546]|uniref:ABC transporter ATP-binding protein n=1 Tax=Dactylosporangium sp. AC04546 TaxID=2862460 RepID=UPI001EDFD2E3|nr:ATP-binding cassette domain-containing protein [Dactylosporangium sp. AC04546]WVK88708.1 ATP-binding cassette domain-containing protein [Dactylosporangium sp. AC04546]
MTAPAIRAERLFRFFHSGDDEVLALRGVSLHLAAGEWLALTGPSGSGKSTLLACLAGLDEPDGGNVWIAGRRITRRPEPARARMRARHIGVLYQAGNLLEHLTVAQNIRFVRRLARLHGDGDDVAARLDAVGLGGRGGALPGELSGGQAARAALAVALANDPAVLVADEPTGELDELTERAVLGLLAARAAAGTAVLVASHSRAVTRAADRVLHLRDGHLLDTGER